ncbi:30S ribosomal protein S15 [bacterium]|nr:MAG: 30S ribosomal protein S15 [bacterium]
MSITKTKKKEIFEKFSREPGDVGSPEVQIALLTERINKLSEHFRQNPKDNNSKRGFFILIGRRKRLLAYLRRKNYTRYKSLIVELGIRR